MSGVPCRFTNALRFAFLAALILTATSALLAAAPALGARGGTPAPVLVDEDRGSDGGGAQFDPCPDQDRDGHADMACGGSDCDNDDPGTYPSAPEICDGYDNDCDGDIDDNPLCGRVCSSPQKAGVDLRLTISEWFSRHPSLVWADGEYGLEWVFTDWGDAWYTFQKLDASGNPIGTLAGLRGDTAYFSMPSLVWTGGHFGASWACENISTYSGGEIGFQRLSSSGSAIQPRFQVTVSPTVPQVTSLVWTGSQFGVVYGDTRSGNAEIHFARLDAVGAKIGSDVNVTGHPGGSFDPSLAWTGSEYGIAWRDNRDGNDEIYFARLDAQGVRIGNETRVTSDPAFSVQPALLWTGTEYGLAWSDGRNGSGEIYFANLDPGGGKVGLDHRITNDPAASAEPFLVWTGAQYGLAWADGRDGNNEIYFAAVDAAGNKIGSEQRITSDPASSTEPSLAWTGTEFGAAWRDNRPGIDEIYFARISCDCTDVDGDGVTSCRPDNCPDLPNPDQADTGGDGTGDACQCPGGPCDDGNACTGPDLCAQGVCAGGPQIDCGDGNPCTADTCNSDTGCAHAPVDCDDRNVCTDDSCDSLAGCVHAANANACDDGNVCTENDACSAGVCGGATGLTNGVPCDDGNPCTRDEACQNGVCAGAVLEQDGAPCSDGNPCTLADHCSGGICIATAAADGAVCQDGNGCTLGDACLGGRCVGSAWEEAGTPCEDGNDCTQDGSCDASGRCVGSNPAPPGVWCEDDNPCSQSSTCDDSGQCVAAAAAPAGTTCDDGKGCTLASACNGYGGCVGAISAPAGLSCGDTRACLQAGACSGNGECLGSTQVPDGASCDDGNACTLTDQCLGGQCVGSTPAETGTPCTTLCYRSGACNMTGHCVGSDPRPDGTPCDDGSACTNSSVCSGSGRCVGQSLAEPGQACDDDNVCTGSSACDASGRCVGAEAASQGTACDDRNACTIGDACSGLACRSGSDVCACQAAIDCDDGNVCTDDACIPGTGCVHTDSTASCSDGLFCNGLETCGNGACQPGAAIPCSDGIACTFDWCSEAADACEHAPCTLDVSAEGSRYLVTSAPPDLASVALLVHSEGVGCLPMYVDVMGRLTVSPAFQSSAQWGVVHIGDRLIVPDTSYTVVAIVAGGSPVASGAARTHAWGDADGQGEVNLFDIICVLDGFQGVYSRCGPREDDQNAGVPDRVINPDDILAVLDSFSGISYPDSDPCSELPPWSGSSRSGNGAPAVDVVDPVPSLPTRP